MSLPKMPSPDKKKTYWNDDGRVIAFRLNRYQLSLLYTMAPIVQICLGCILVLLLWMKWYPDYSNPIEYTVKGPLTHKELTANADGKPVYTLEYRDQDGEIRTASTTGTDFGKWKIGDEVRQTFTDPQPLAFGWAMFGVFFLLGIMAAVVGAGIKYGTWLETIETLLFKGTMPSAMVMIDYQVDWSIAATKYTYENGRSVVVGNTFDTPEEAAAYGSWFAKWGVPTP